MNTQMQPNICIFQIYVYSKYMYIPNICLFQMNLLKKVEVFSPLSLIGLDTVDGLEADIVKLNHNTDPGRGFFRKGNETL